MSGAELVAWAFRSPRRLAAVAAIGIAVVVGLGYWSQRGSEASQPQARSAASAPSASAPAQVPDASPFVDAAVRFVDQWASLREGETAAQWQQRVSPLVTSELAAALRLTDTDSLPGGSPSGEPVVRFVSGSSALVAVPLSTGGRVLVTVLQDAGAWRVSDVQPDEGDAGASP